MLERYGSLSEFASQCAATGRSPRSGEPEWAGASFDDALTLAENGDDRIAAALESRAEAIMPARTGRVTARVPDGGAVDIGAYLANEPLLFTRREKRRSDKSPVSIVVNVTAGANFSPAQVQARGATILALVQALSETRAVTLTALIITHAKTDGWYAARVELDTRPLSLAHAGFALCHVAMLRQLGFSRASADGFNGDWAQDRSDEATRTRAEIAADDIYIREMHNNDPLALRPAEWLEETLAQILERE